LVILSSLENPIPGPFHSSVFKSLGLGKGQTLEPEKGVGIVGGGVFVEDWGLF